MKMFNLVCQYEKIPFSCDCFFILLYLHLLPFTVQMAICASSDNIRQFLPKLLKVFSLCLKDLI